jgi:hypothetical protein
MVSILEAAGLVGLGVIIGGSLMYALVVVAVRAAIAKTLGW